MDFHTLSRKELQALCKMNRIPANITNMAMADALKALPQVEGLEGIKDQQFLSPTKMELLTPRPPRTSAKTVTRSTRRTVKKEEEVKEITDGIARIGISDTPSTVTGRKVPRARQTAIKDANQKKEMDSTEMNLMVTPAGTARRSSARLRSKVTIGSETPVVVKEEVIEENDGKTARTRQYSRRRSVLPMEEEKEFADEVEKRKDLLFPEEIQEQKVIVESKNTVVEENDELYGITVEAEISNLTVEKVSVDFGESTLVPVIVEETSEVGESVGEILVTPFYCDDESTEGEVKDATVEISFENVANVEVVSIAEIPATVCKVEPDEQLPEVEEGSLVAEISSADSSIESEEVTVEVESTEEIPETVCKVESDEQLIEVEEGSFVAAISSADSSVTSEEVIVEVESTEEFPATVCKVESDEQLTEVEEGSFVAAISSADSSIVSEEVTVEVELIAEIPSTVCKAECDDIPAEVQNSAVESGAETPTRSEAITADLSEAISELSELLAKTPISAKQHLVILQEQVPTSTKKIEKTINDKENLGINAIKQKDFKDMSMRKLKSELKKVSSKKKNNNTEEDVNQKRAALTPLKENCMRKV